MTTSFSSGGDKASKTSDIKEMANGSQAKATYDGLLVVITVLNQIKRIGLSDFDRTSLEILYKVICDLFL